MELCSNNTKNIILVTHSSSIICFIENIIGQKMKEYRQKNNMSKIIFNNSAIIKIEINNCGSVKIYLEFDGNNKETKNNFFTNNKNNINGVYFEPVIIDFLKFNIFLLDLNNKNYNIFIIRHAQAEHNINKNNKKQDTLLTNTGLTQAHNIGIIIQKILNKNKINYLFSSNLRRTRQTLEIISTCINCDSLDIIVLPCTHDLKASNDGYCNFKITKNISIAGQMLCDIPQDNCNQNDLCCFINNKKINWEFYEDNKKINCMENNIIKIILQYINYNDTTT